MSHLIKACEKYTSKINFLKENYLYFTIIKTSICRFSFQDLIVQYGLSYTNMHYAAMVKKVRSTSQIGSITDDSSFRLPLRLLTASTL